MDERRFSQLVDNGTISRAERGAYDLDRVREQYVRHLREVAASRKPTGPLDPSQEKGRKDKELADQTALRNAAMRRELLPRDEVRAAVVDAFSRVRSKLLALPSKLAPLVARSASIADARQKISDGIKEALSELAATRVADEGFVDGPSGGSGDGGRAVGRLGSSAGSVAKRVGRPRASA
jgi:phage terminase Nu1 subunit (DNA packaging protein)